MTTLKVFKIITEKTSSYVFSRGCLAAILVCGWFLLHFLQDRVVGFDASSWFENALNLYENGKTGVSVQEYSLRLYSLYSIGIKNRLYHVRTFTFRTVGIVYHGSVI